jgi:hypothetical protein
VKGMMYGCMPLCEEQAKKIIELASKAAGFALFTGEYSIQIGIRISFQNTELSSYYSAQLKHTD